MSYEIVRGIKIEGEKVLVNCASNNVYPRDFGFQEIPSFGKILKTEGQEALDIVILEAYEEGNFQGGSNKYTRALKVLRHLPEYANYDWRTTGEVYEQVQKNRVTQGYKDLLKKALKTRLPADKFILTKDYFGTEVYLFRFGGRCAKWIPEKSRAKIFKYANDAEDLKRCFTNSEGWQVERIK